VLSGRGLCDELITRPEESYRMCCVVVCDLEASRIGAPHTQIYIYIYMCVCDISNLRVKFKDSRRPLSTAEGDRAVPLSDVAYWVSASRAVGGKTVAARSETGRFQRRALCIRLPFLTFQTPEF